MNSIKLAAVFALGISAGISGCAAQTDGTDETTDGQDHVAAVDEATPVAASEKTGEASQKCFGGGLPFFAGAIGFGGCGSLGPCSGWGGPAFAPFGGWGLFGGCGCGCGF